MDPEHEQNFMRIDSKQHIKAPPEKVFTAITTGINEWMPYRQRPEAKIVFETRPGGLIYEDWGKEGYLLFGTLVAYNPPNLMIVVGPDGYGESTFSTRSIERVESDGKGGSIHKKTLLVWGVIPEQSAESFLKGVPGMGEMVKVYVEEGKTFRDEQ